MSEWTIEEQNRIINQFHRYCYNVLQNEAINLYKNKTGFYKNTVHIEDLTAKDIFENAICFPEFTDSMFHIGSDSILVKDPDLAESMKKLSPYRLDIILLYYFLEFSEQEIATRFQRSQQAISRQKKLVLQELRNSMKEASNEE